MVEKDFFTWKKNEVSMRNLSHGLTLLILLILLMTGCGLRDQNRVQDVFRYNEPAGISSLDPAFARNQANIWATSQLFNGLVQLDKDLIVRPCIAKDWDISEDGLTYTFHLRQDVYFHHDLDFSGEKGRKVNAGDFVFSFNRLDDAKTASPGAWVFQMLDRANDGLAVKAVNDSTLTLKLREPFPPFLGILTMPYCVVVLPEAVKEFGEDFRRKPIGSGPFRFKYWKEGTKLILRRNPHYFESIDDQQLPLMEAISISFVIDRQAAFLEFIKGNLDFMSGIDPSYKDEVLSPDGQLLPKYKERIQLSSQPYLNTEYLGFMLEQDNPAVQDSPYLDKRIRQAMNLGFDRYKMIQYLRNNIGTPGTSGFIPKGLPGFDALGRIGYTYDPGKAECLLAEAGYPAGKGLPPLTLSTSPDYLDICKYVQYQLNDIGIPMKIEVTPPAALKELKAQGKLPFFRGSWIADYPDAENYLSVFLSQNHCPAGPNYCRFSSAAFDKMYIDAMRQTNDSVRNGHYFRMDSLIMAEAPVIVLYYDMVLRFSAINVKGLGSNPINMLNLKHVYKTTSPD